MISLIGLGIIVVAWFLQFLFMDKKKKISILFVTVYSIGVAFLIYDSFTSGLNNLAIANLVSLAASLAVLIKLNFY